MVAQYKRRSGGLRSLQPIVTSHADLHLGGINGQVRERERVTNNKIKVAAANFFSFSTWDVEAFLMFNLLKWLNFWSFSNPNVNSLDGWKGNLLYSIQVGFMLLMSWKKCDKKRNFLLDKWHLFNWFAFHMLKWKIGERTLPIGWGLTNAHQLFLVFITALRQRSLPLPE